MKSTTTSRVGVLQELLTRLQDSAFGYSKAMHLASQGEFADFCKNIARERGLLAAELGLVIAELGGEADFRGSKEARLERAWIPGHSKISAAFRLIGWSRHVRCAHERSD